MSDGMTDDSRAAIRRVEKYLSEIGPVLDNPVMGGLRVDPMFARIGDMEKRIAALGESIAIELTKMEKRITVLEEKTKAENIRITARS